MNIPSRVNPFGYDNSTPPGYMRAEFLGVYGRQYIDTGFPFVEDVGFKVAETPTGTYAILRFGVGNGSQTACCVTGLSSASSSDYPITYYWGSSIQRVGGSFIVPTNYLQEAELNWKNSSTYWWQCPELDKTIQGNITKGEVDALRGMSIYLFALNLSGAANFGVEFNNFRCFSAKLSQQKDVVRDFIPAIDSTGTPCMFDTVTGQPFRNAGSGQFTVGLTMPQALNLANLPETGGSMTISIPLEAAFDDGVESALNAAADKGWTITVQYRESELTTKNIDADFLESTGTQGIQIPYTFDKNTGIECEGIMPINKDALLCYIYLYYDYRYVGLLYNKVVDNKIYVNEYGTAYDGTDVRLPNKVKRSKARYNWKNDKILYINNGETSASVYNDKYVKNLTSQIINVFYNERFNSFYPGVIYSFSVSQYENVVIKLIPALDPTGTPCMHDTVSGQNFYNANTAEGATPFIVGFDTTEKAAISISKLPVTSGGTLTVSLPAEAQYTESRVPDAIEIATNRGWTIITQYRDA